MGYGAEAIAKARQIIDLVAGGSDLDRAAKDIGLSVKTFHEVVSSVGEIGLAYTRAQECRMILEVDEAKRIADDPSLDPQRARNQIDIRKWRAAKLNPRVFGDRIDLTVQGQISVRDALTIGLANAGLLPGYDQDSIVDAQVIEQSTISVQSASDAQSDTSARRAAPVPDIFS